MSSEKRRFQGLEGLRVFAIIMVVAGHVGVLANTAGGIGNKLFFVLSGFLAYFSTKNINDLNSLLQFYLKKIVRIVPTYWIVILFAWKMFPGVFRFHDFSTEHSLLLNLCFWKTYGHLWFMQQIMLMYLCVPLLQFLMRWIKKCLERGHVNERVSNLVCAAISVVLAVLELNFLTSDLFHLSGEGSHAQFQIWIFLFGFAAAHIYEAVKGISLSEIQKRILNIFTDVYIVCFMLVLFFFVIPAYHEKYVKIAEIMDMEMLRTILCCIAILLLAAAEGNYIAKWTGCTACKMLSDISFGIYMVHFFFLGSFMTVSGVWNFISNFLISMCVAYFIYHVVEKNLTERLRHFLSDFRCCSL